MNVLLDFLTFKWNTGAAEYARRVYYALMNRIRIECNGDIKLFAIYDSSEGIAYEDMQLGCSITNDVIYIDLCKATLYQHIVDNKIDVFFVACAQYFSKCLDLENVKCKCVCVIHDLAYEELYKNSLDYYFKLIVPKYKLGDRNKYDLKYLKDTIKLLKWFLNIRLKRYFEEGLNHMQPLLRLYNTNENTYIVTVSNYTRTSLQYQYDIDPSKVNVLYSPERVYTSISNSIDNKALEDLIKSGKKYYLMLSANRQTKNPHKCVKACKRFSELNPDSYFLIIGYPNKIFENMINPSFLSDSDLAIAIKNCYALIYPTFFEGFGYPAIEAMHYGKPVLCSNTTSLPEILDDAPIYFSPLYETEIFNALIKLTKNNYQKYVEKATVQYKKISSKQEDDLNKLLDLILTK